MAQIEVNLRDIYRVLRKRKWIIVVAPILMAVATFFMTAPPVPVYEGKALVKISRSSILTGLLVDYISYSPYDNMSTQILVVTSRPVLEEVAKRLNMMPPGTNPDSAVDNLKGRVNARQQGNSDILEITATGLSREQAITLANLTAEVYIKQSAAAKNKRIDDTVDFVGKQLALTDADLKEAEEAYTAFKQANGNALALNSTQTLEIQEKRFLYQQKMQDARAALTTLARVQQSKDYEAVSQALLQLDEPMSRTLGDELARRSSSMADLRNKKADLLRYQREASPPVIAVSAQLSAEERRLESQVGALTRRLTRVASEYERLDKVLAGQEADIARQPMLLRELEKLQTAIREKQEMASNLRKRLQDAEIQQKEKIEDISFVERAQSAGRLAENSRYYQALIGMLVGVLLGGVFAFVLESLDTSIGTIEDVEEYISASVLGVIPHIQIEEVMSRLKLEDFPSHVTGEDLSRFSRLVTHFDQKSVAAESYRTLKTNVAGALARNGSKGKKVILITSSVLQEGKTTSSCNIALAFAQGGQKTLLIDADLRRPITDKVFGVERSPGLTEVLFGTRTLKECCRTVEDFILGDFGLKMAQLTPGLGFLYLLPAGRIADNPAELLNSVAMDKLIAEAREMFEIVVIDVSPVLPVADASILAPKVDGVIMSYQIGRIGREVLKRSKMRLETLGATILGIIMNDIQAEIDYRRSDYYYHYRYRYEPNLPQEGAPLLERLKRKLRGSKSTRSPARPAATSKETQNLRPPPPSAAFPPPGDSELRDIMGLTDDK
ncbi:MAG: polysaccharide biosynthesis tyrosine autokinase [Acidobacteria bacterium]|nr:polysaccharide biosynthesis tyrosine autokinase [Acidobacteriota bacterium]